MAVGTPLRAALSGHADRLFMPLRHAQATTLTSVLPVDLWERHPQLRHNLHLGRPL